MIGGDHHHHAECGKQGQHHEFTAEQIAHGEILARIDQHHGNRQVSQQLQHIGHQIVHEHVVKDQRHAVCMCAHGDQRTAHQGELHQHVSDQPAALLDQRIRNQYHARHDQQEDFRAGRHQISHQIHIHLELSR